MAKDTEKDQRKKRDEDKARESFTRADFFRDLKKVAKRRERPSQRDSETH